MLACVLGKVVGEIRSVLCTRTRFFVSNANTKVFEIGYDWGPRRIELNRNIKHMRDWMREPPFDTLFGNLHVWANGFLLCIHPFSIAGMRTKRELLAVQANILASILVATCARRWISAGQREAKFTLWFDRKEMELFRVLTYNLNAWRIIKWFD